MLASLADMDQTTPSQNRRNGRSNVLMTATLECGGAVSQVKLRNLSSEGALVQGKGLPIEGSELIFLKGELALAGRVVWVHGGRAGVMFAEPLDPQLVMRHVPVPRPRVKLDFRRPGLYSAVSPIKRKLAES